MSDVFCMTFNIREIPVMEIPYVILALRAEVLRGRAEIQRSQDYIRLMNEENKERQCPTT